MNSTSLVRQYDDILSSGEMIFMPKGVPNKRYTPAFKKQVIETILKGKLSYRETARRFEVNDHHRIQDREHIYLTEGAEGFTIEWRGRGNTSKRIPKQMEEYLLRKCNDCVRRTNR